MGDLLKTTLVTRASQSPDFKAALRILLKFEVHTLLQRLSDVGEEAVVIIASPDDGHNGHLGSNKGEDFLRQSQTVHSLQDQFLLYCCELRNASTAGGNEQTKNQPCDTGGTIILKDEVETEDTAVSSHSRVQSVLVIHPSEMTEQPIINNGGSTLRHSVPVLPISISPVSDAFSSQTELFSEAGTTAEPAIDDLQTGSCTNHVQEQMHMSTIGNQLILDADDESATLDKSDISPPIHEVYRGIQAAMYDTDTDDANFTEVKIEVTGEVDQYYMDTTTQQRMVVIQAVSVDTSGSIPRDARNDIGHHDERSQASVTGSGDDYMDTYDDSECYTNDRNPSTHHADDDRDQIHWKTDVYEAPSPTTAPAPPIDYFFCDHCMYSTMDRSDFETHLFLCAEAHNLTCLSCSTRFVSLEELQIHTCVAAPVHEENIPAVTANINTLTGDSGVRKNKQHRIIQFRCRQCERTFITKASLKKHVYKLHMWKCQICKLPFRSRALMLNHWKQNHKECRLCDKRFLTKQTLRTHEIRYHTPGQLGNHADAAAGVKHAQGAKTFDRIHALTHICKICRKTFDRGLLLKRHMLALHNESRPIQRKSVRRYKLDTDTNVCTNDSNNDNAISKEHFSCLRARRSSQTTTHHKDIDAAYSELMDLETAPSVILEPLSESTLEELNNQGGTCNVGSDMKAAPQVMDSLSHDGADKTAESCGKIISDKSTSTNVSTCSPKMVDAFETPTKCPYCEKMFQFRTIMVRHMKKCRDAKHYICSICYLSFSNEYSLSGHTQSHSTENLSTTPTRLLLFRIHKNVAACVVCDCEVETVKKHMKDVHSSTQGPVRIEVMTDTGGKLQEITMDYADTAHDEEGMHIDKLSKDAGKTVTTAHLEYMTSDCDTPISPNSITDTDGDIQTTNIQQPTTVTNSPNPSETSTTFPLVVPSPTATKDTAASDILGRMDSFLKMKRIAPISSLNQEHVSDEQPLEIEQPVNDSSSHLTSIEICHDAGVAANEILIEQDGMTTDSFLGHSEEVDEASSYLSSSIDFVDESMVLCDCCGGLCDAELITGHVDTCDYNKKSVSDSHKDCGITRVLDTEGNIASGNCEKIIIEAPHGRKLCEPNKNNLFDCFICEKVLCSYSYLIKHRKTEHPNIILVPYGKSDWKKKKLMAANSLKTVVEIPRGRTLYQANKDKLFDCFICTKTLYSFTTAKLHRTTKHPNVALVPYGKKRWMERKLAAERKLYNEVNDENVVEMPYGRKMEDPNKNNLFDCFICEKELCSLTSAKSHRQEKHPNIVLAPAGKKEVIRQQLKVKTKAVNNTVEDHHGACNIYESVACSYCHVKFNRKRLLKRHIEDVHEVKEKVTVAEKHIKKVNNQHECLYCGKMIGISLLERAEHYIGEHAEMPVANSFRAHFCPYCDYVMCKNYFILSLHVTSKHKNEAVQFRRVVTYDTCKFKCHICDQRFFKWPSFKNHVLCSHQPVQPSNIAEVANDIDDDDCSEVV